MSASFGYAEFDQLIQAFTAEVPQLLKKHHITADLASRVERLLDITDTPFTLAVVGQMRAGKSSLLNALMEADLAVTGVNETTATINWFMHGQDGRCDRFRVVWKNRPAEEFDRSEIGRWAGNSELAAATRYIEFYADSPFLRFANIVDTPGTRSVIESHEDTIRSFLSAKLDQDTRHHGGQADAILYVLMPVARQSDKEMLADFDQATRLPGSSPFNSFAVVHKWETLEADDPLVEACRKAERISRSMRDAVSGVLPVSAPLARAVHQFSDAFWDHILNLSLNTPPDILKDALLSELDFMDFEDSRCSLSGADRRALREQYKLPWPSFRYIVNLTRSRLPGNMTDLRAAVQEASGISRLREELTRRFFSRSKIIRSFRNHRG